MFAQALSCSKLNFIILQYQYSQQPHCMQLTSLIKIVLNTLDSQHHHCRRIPATVIMGAPPSRSRGKFPSTFT